jgi:hypothetical protein
MWRKQGDGRWKCIADTWNSDGPGTAAPGPTAVGPSGSAVATAAAAPVAPPVAKLGAEAAPRASESGQGGEYGAAPVNYEATVHRYFQDYLRDPDSARYREITAPEQSSIKALTGGVIIRQSTLKGWTVKATVDAKNSQGAYVGFKTYLFLFRGEKIVHTTSPLTGDEMK